MRLSKHSGANKTQKKTSLRKTTTCNRQVPEQFQ